MYLFDATLLPCADENHRAKQRRALDVDEGIFAPMCFQNLLVHTNSVLTICNGNKELLEPGMGMDTVTCTSSPGSRR